MKNKKFRVFFPLDVILTIFALGEDEAIILAQSEQIKAGKSYVVSRIEEIDEDKERQEWYEKQIGNA